MASARELQRVKSIQQAPIIHHYEESIAGAVTVRGFGQEKRFIDINMELYDKYMRPSFYALAAIQWLVFRMELLTTLVFSSCMLLVIWFPSKAIDSGETHCLLQSNSYGHCKLILSIIGFQKFSG
jgi:ABC-type multidrug transport system fused ATPase/permease subunit